MTMGKIGFMQHEAEKPVSDSLADAALDAFFSENTESGRWTSTDIVRNLAETVKVTKSQVYKYMTRHGYSLEREDDRLVWVIE